MGTMPSSGAISFSDMQSKMGRGHTGAISLSHFYRDGSPLHTTSDYSGYNNSVPTSGTISMSNFHGARGTLYDGTITCVAKDITYNPAKGSGFRAWGKGIFFFDSWGSSSPDTIYEPTNDHYAAIRFQYQARWENSAHSYDAQSFNIANVTSNDGGTDVPCDNDIWTEAVSSNGTWVRGTHCDGTNSQDSFQSNWGTYNDYSSGGHARDVIPVQHVGNQRITIYSK